MKKGTEEVDGRAAIRVGDEPLSVEVPQVPIPLAFLVPLAPPVPLVLGHEHWAGNQATLWDISSARARMTIYVSRLRSDYS